MEITNEQRLALSKEIKDKIILPKGIEFAKFTDTDSIVYIDFTQRKTLFTMFVWFNKDNFAQSHRFVSKFNSDASPYEIVHKLLDDLDDFITYLKEQGIEIEK